MIGAETRLVALLGDPVAHYFTADESDFLRKVCQYGYACD